MGYPWTPPQCRYIPKMPGLSGKITVRVMVLHLKTITKRSFRYWGKIGPIHLHQPFSSEPFRFAGRWTNDFEKPVLHIPSSTTSDRFK